jgi:light-regulated signal transduction histidine kinase (bacteriophytochrome)
MYDAQGKFVMSRSTVTDITEHKQIHAALHDLNGKLQAANQELESFSYSVSHDLRAPLRAVDGYALMLEEDYGAKLDDEGRRLLGVVREGAAQMGRLIDDLLNFSQVGRKPIARDRLDMGALAREVVAASSQARAKPRIEIGELPAATGDRALLRQVWLNLIGNALKYSARSGHPVVQIGARVEGAEQIYWVRDNGAGFDMRYYDKLFGVFQRLHSDADFEGSGVGLALVKRIVTRHGGRVWADGRPDAGATFGFALPERLRTVQAI